MDFYAKIAPLRVGGFLEVHDISTELSSDCLEASTSKGWIWGINVRSGWTSPMNLTYDVYTSRRNSFKSWSSQHVSSKGHLEGSCAKKRHGSWQYVCSFWIWRNVCIHQENGKREKGAPFIVSSVGPEFWFQNQSVSNQRSKDLNMFGIVQATASNMGWRTKTPWIDVKTLEVKTMWSWVWDQRPWLRWSWISIKLSPRMTIHMFLRL